MFTGIIDHCAVIEHISEIEQGIRVLIKSQFENLIVGESIAVDGICLTVVQPENGSFYCELSPETHRVTTAKYFTVGNQVNLERALCLNDRLGGHLVSGHVDTVAKVAGIQQQGEFQKIILTDINLSHMALLSPKGSVAINGVSLTVNAVSPSNFEVMLIPHTLERTNLHLLRVGDLVNIEFDIIARYVFEQLNFIRHRDEQ